MTNVKPGDVARIISSNDGNVGAQVYVEKLESMGHGIVFWWVEVLEPVKAIADLYSRNKPFIVPPGTLAIAADIDLRRIDPPAEDLTEESLEVVLIQMESNT